MIIAGELRRIKRPRIVVPNDGVHIAYADGTMRGVHSVYIGDRIVPHGITGFYWRVSEYLGMKVYYSIEKHFAYGLDYVKNIWRRTTRAWADTKINPQPTFIGKVKIDITHKGKHRNLKAYAITVAHCHAPEPAWTQYITGHPYDWACLDSQEHPLHNPQAYLAFKRTAKETARAYGMDATGKLGDIIYCTKQKRWFLVDCG